MEGTFVNAAREALLVTVLVSAPPLLAALVVGLTISVFQALTQVQEQTLSFAIKLVAVTLTLILSARWIGGELFTYSLRLFDTFPLLVK
jgi:type III secretion protein S